jgi:hypothetical protein
MMQAQGLFFDGRTMIGWMINNNNNNNNNTTMRPRIPVLKAGEPTGKTQPRPDMGQLPGHIPEPMFVADPGHRKKLFTKQLHALKSSGVANNCTITRMDIVRLGKFFGYMAKGLR